jgi:uncharacterized integral membrane protein
MKCLSVCCVFTSNEGVWLINWVVILVNAIMYILLYVLVVAEKKSNFLLSFFAIFLCVSYVFNSNASK